MKKLENINLKKLFILLNATHKEVIDEGIKLLNELEADAHLYEFHQSQSNTESEGKKKLKETVGVWFCKCGWANAFKTTRMNSDVRLGLNCSNPNCTLPSRRVDIMYKLKPKVKIIYCNINGNKFKYRGEAEFYANEFNRRILQ